VPGLFFVVEVHPSRRAIAVHIGPAAAIRGHLPAAMRAAWVAGEYGETDADP
jgi:hypothetical protein